MKYSPWLIKRDKELAWLEDFPDKIRRKSYLLDKGLAVKHWFPKDVEFKMAMNSGMKLSDALPKKKLEEIRGHPQ